MFHFFGKYLNPFNLLYSSTTKKNIEDGEKVLLYCEGNLSKITNDLFTSNLYESEDTKRFKIIEYTSNKDIEVFETIGPVIMVIDGKTPRLSVFSEKYSPYTVLFEKLIQKGYDPYIWIINEQNLTSNVEKLNVLFDIETSKTFIQNQPYLERTAFESKLVIMNKNMNNVQKKLFNYLINDSEIKSTKIKCLKVLFKDNIKLIPLNKENDIYSMKEFKDGSLIVYQLPFYVEIKVEKGDLICDNIIFQLKTKEKIIQIDNFCKFISN